MQTVNFLLIKNLCIVDLVGALVVLPVPLIATAKGQWDFGESMCMINSVVNVALWFQVLYTRNPNPKIKNSFEYGGTQHRLQK